MKKIFLYTFLFSLVYVSCQKPDVISPNTDNTIGNVWATIPGYNATQFKATFNTSMDSAFIDLPYYYPEESDNETDLTHALIRMNVPFDAMVSPSLSQPLNITNPVRITVTSGSGDTRSFILAARKTGNYAIKKISIKYNATDSVEGIINGTDVLFFIVPGTDVTNSKLTYSVNPHSTANIANNATINLSQPLPFIVTGADGKSVTYTLKAQEPRRLSYGIGIYRKLWYMAGTAAGIGTGSNETAIAVSGNYLLVLNNLAVPGGSIKVYDRLSMAYVRNMALPSLTGVRFFGMHADSTGNIIISSFTPSGQFYIYKYTSPFDEAPVKLVQYAYPAGMGTSLGRTVRVFGDLNKNAIITSHSSGNANIWKWIVTNGAVVSQTPDIMTYTSLTTPSGSTTTWGNYAEAIAASTTTNTNYFISYPGELAYVNGITNARISGYPISTATGVTYQYPITTFNFNNARYLVAAFMKNSTFNSAYFSLYDITDPSKFGTPSAKIMDSELTPAGGSNGNGTGDVAAIASADKTKVHVYLMLTNGGIMCYEFTLYAAN